jgi:PIN domain nuclease of toxin-antitoxin system
VRLIVDTHILVWATLESTRLPVRARDILGDSANKVYFSIASLWELAIKSSLGRENFTIDVTRLQSCLLDNGYDQLPIAIDHFEVLATLEHRHKDPFDRLLIAQARAEGLTLLTSDRIVASYGGDVIKV